MSTLSIIIPVYKVQGFVRECLESIFASSHSHLEVIAVDDCSPDNSAAILAEYAATEPRLHVVQAPQNLGSGEARNLGFDRAVGEYVWFVDADDLVTPGSVEAVTSALEAYDPQQRPDVLFFDYERVDELGNAVASDLPGLLAQSRPPEVFAFSDWPAAARYTHTIWNKVVRRQFLIDIGIRFHPGWYMDMPWTYPVILAAERMALLDRVCYQWRQRRAGSITRTRDDRHFEAFTQWERVWDELSCEAGDTVGLAIYHRMIWHLMQVLGNDERVPGSQRRRFFHRVAEVYHRRHPGPAYKAPRGGEGLKHFLLRRRWYGGYCMVRLLRRTYHRLRFGHPFGRAFSRSPKAALAAAATRLRARVVGTGGMAGLGGVYYRLQRLRPVDDDLVVFASAGWRGRHGDPAALADKVAELLPDSRLLWLSTEPDADYPHAKPGSAAAYRALARAKYVVSDVDFGDFFVKRPETTWLRSLPHATLTAVGVQRLRLDGGDLAQADRLLHSADQWDCLVTPNPHASEVLDQAFPVAAQHLEYGRPANDRLLAATAADRAAARDALGVADGERLVVYRPAPRPTVADYPAFDASHVQAQLPATAVAVVSDEAGGAQVSDAFGKVVDAVDAAAAYIACDVLVTDYADALADFTVFDRPIVLYAPDWEHVRDIHGVNVDLAAAGPGPLLRHLDDVITRLRELHRGDDFHAASRHEFRRRFNAWERGDAAERVVRRVFGVEAPLDATVGVHDFTADSAAGSGDDGVAAVQKTEAVSRRVSALVNDWLHRRA